MKPRDRASPGKRQPESGRDFVRELQPHMLIYSRSQFDEDFATPEGSVNPDESGHRWEECLPIPEIAIEPTECPADGRGHEFT